MFASFTARFGLVWLILVHFGSFWLILAPLLASPIATPLQGGRPGRPGSSLRNKRSGPFGAAAAFLFLKLLFIWAWRVVGLCLQHCFGGKPNKNSPKRPPKAKKGKKPCSLHHRTKDFIFCCCRPTRVNTTWPAARPLGQRHAPPGRRPESWQPPTKTRKKARPGRSPGVALPGVCPTPPPLRGRWALHINRARVSGGGRRTQPRSATRLRSARAHDAACNARSLARGERAAPPRVLAHETRAQCAM